MILTACLVANSTAFAEIINSGVAFRETGLPTGTNWTVICNGTQYSATSSDITILLPPGTYNFSVPEVSGYTAFPKNGTVTAILDPIKLTAIEFSAPIPELSILPLTFGVFIVAVTVGLLVMKELRR